jgi:hypothetical protein
MKFSFIASFAITGFALLASNSASAYTIYQSEDPNFTIPFAAGTAAESNFIGALPGAVLTETLDGLTVPTIAPQSIFGGLATLTQPGSGGMFLGSDSECYSGSQCILGFPDVNPAFGINFSNPVAGFGFWANDQNTVGDQITVLVNGGAVTLGPSAATGGSSFYGFIAGNSSEYITSLAFASSNPTGGFLTFDQFTIGQAPAQATGVPGPIPLFGTAAAFGFSRKLRKRIKTSSNPVSSSYTI